MTDNGKSVEEEAYLAEFANSLEDFTKMPVRLGMQIYILFADYEVSRNSHDGIMFLRQ